MLNGNAAFEIPADVPEWAELVCVGTWEGHPQAPQLITAEHLAASLAYFDLHYKGNGVDLPIDYHHSSVVAGAQGTKAPAAGWIKAMELRADGTQLWGQTAWNEAASKEIAAREFRYLSPVLRWGAKDRVSGKPVPMMIHSAALTNTPFLTELQSLNEAGVTSPVDGGQTMKLMEMILATAGLLGQKADDVLSALGLTAEAEDKPAFEAILAHAAKANAATPAVTEGIAGTLGIPKSSDEAAVNAAIVKLKAGDIVVNDAVAGMLGVATGSNETAVKAAVLKMQAGGDLGPIRTKLGLNADVPIQEVLTTLDGMQATRHRQQAEELIDAAVKAGQVPPAQKEFFLNAAVDNLEATRLMLAGTPVMTALMAQTHSPTGPAPNALDADDKHMCQILGVKEEDFLATKVKQAEMAG